MTKKSKDYEGPFREQCQIVLTMLRMRPHTNRELSKAALKYTGRISDLRKWGCVIIAIRLANGFVIYVLEKEP